MRSEAADTGTLDSLLLLAEPSRTMLLYDFTARTAVLPHAQGRQSLNRLALSAATVLLACVSSAAHAAGVVNTSVASQAASQRARLAHGAALDLSGPRPTATGMRSQAPLPLDAPRPSSWRAGAISLRRPAHDALGPEAAVESFARARFAIRWQSSPELVRVARRFRRSGLPIVRLWESGRGLVAIGLNPHGVPGIYFTQKVAD